MELNDVEWKKLIDNGESVVIDFSAESWCAPCRTIAPIIDKLSEKYVDKIKIGKIDVDNNIELANIYNVRNVPTVLFIKNGQIIDKIIGVSQELNYEQKIKNLINT